MFEILSLYALKYFLTNLCVENTEVFQKFLFFPFNRIKICYTIFKLFKEKDSGSSDFRQSQKESSEVNAMQKGLSIAGFVLSVVGIMVSIALTVLQVISLKSSR